MRKTSILWISDPNRIKHNETKSIVSWGNLNLWAGDSKRTNKSDSEKNKTTKITERIILKIISLSYQYQPRFL